MLSEKTPSPSVPGSSGHFLLSATLILPNRLPDIQAISKHSRGHKLESGRCDRHAHGSLDRR